jgi:hypothetical protein
MVEFLDLREADVHDPGAAGAALLHHFWQAVQGLGTEHQIDIRCTAADLRPFLARHAAADADDQVGILLFQVLPATQ